MKSSQYSKFMRTTGIALAALALVGLPATTAGAKTEAGRSDSISTLTPEVDSETKSQGADHRSDRADKDVPPSERGQGDEHRSDKSKGHSKNDGPQGTSAKKGAQVAINVLVKGEITQSHLNRLSRFGEVLDQFPQISIVTMKTTSEQIDAITKLDFVSGLNEDSPREAAPISQSLIAQDSESASTWNLDMINVADGTGSSTRRETSYTGQGVYVAVLDTGLVKNWRSYFGSNIAEEYAAAFGGGGGEKGTVSTQPHKWELDQDSHGTHVTSTIIGYNMPSRKIMGVAPDATVIPVKVLGQQGSGWSSVIARGIMYITELKRGPLRNHPLIINMSLGGPTLDVMEKAAIDDAISAGVIIVASAGNSGFEGMGYPGAYAPVISVAAAGWTGEWQQVASGAWWRSVDVAETGSASAYITSFSSRAKSGQQLDIAAPGSWIVGPYQTNGKLDWYFLGGTSMAAPHVTGVAAVLAQKASSLSQLQIESYLKLSANPFSHWSSTVLNPSGISKTYTWASDATGSGLVDAMAALALVTP